MPLDACQFRWEKFQTGQHRYYSQHEHEVFLASQMVSLSVPRAISVETQIARGFVCPNMGRPSDIRSPIVDDGGNGMADHPLTIQQFGSLYRLTMVVSTYDNFKKRLNKQGHPLRQCVYSNFFSKVYNGVSPPLTKIDSLIRDSTWISELARLNFDQLRHPS
jgi:hypothetical protein